MSTDHEPRQARTRGRKPRLIDIAQEAGVGIATVERVLNGRSNVLPKTAQRVIVAARKLGYDRTLPALSHGVIRIEVVLVRTETEFFNRMNKEFQRPSLTFDRSVVLHRSLLSEGDHQAIADKIAKASVDRAGLIIVAQDEPAIVAALQSADAKNLPIVLLVSDVRYGGKAVYVGIDNECAGRTAGYLMRAMLRGRSGRVVALGHSGSYLAHRQRMIGFAQQFPQDEGVVFSACHLTKDLDDISYSLLRGALLEADDLIGVYNTGGGAAGVDRALRDAGRKADLTYIGHELGKDTARSLSDGLMALTIDQAPELQVRRAVETVECLIGLREGSPDLSPVPFQIITPKNAHW